MRYTIRFPKVRLTLSISGITVSPNCMRCAIPPAHHKVRPVGMAGGEAGELGKTLVRRLDGRVDVLEACDQTVLTVTVITPTVGGNGRAE